MRIAIIVSQFNKDISDRLLAGAKKALQERKVKKFEVFEVPGAFEIPFFCKRIAPEFDGMMALGCVLKGETDHYAAVCSAVTYGMQKVAMETGKPVMFGVLMCRTKAQALERSNKDRQNKGYECAKGLLELMKIK